MSKIHENTYKANTNEWYTPLGLIEKVLEAAEQYCFDLDVCSSMLHIPAKNFYTPQENGLTKEWGFKQTCWMNPPYGNDLRKWVEKAAYEAKENYNIVFALLPADRIGNKYFHELVLQQAACICFLRSPFYFLKNENGVLKESGKAGFPICLAVYSKNKKFVDNFVGIFQGNDGVAIMREFEI